MTAIWRPFKGPFKERDTTTCKPGGRLENYKAVPQDNAVSAAALRRALINHNPRLHYSETLLLEKEIDMSVFILFICKSFYTTESFSWWHNIQNHNPGSTM